MPLKGPARRQRETQQWLGTPGEGVVGTFAVNCTQPVPPSNCTLPDALVLEKPLPDDALRVVTKGEKEDGPEVEVPEHLG